MGDLLGVAVRNCRQHFANDAASLWLCEAVGLLLFSGWGDNKGSHEVFVLRLPVVAQQTCFSNRSNSSPPAQSSMTR